MMYSCEDASKTITVYQLKELLDRGENWQLMDVREAYEHDIVNLGGILLPLSLIEAKKEDPSKISSDRSVVVYCRSGQRSRKSITLLKERYGLQNLYNLEGGVNEWARVIDRTMARY